MAADGYRGRFAPSPTGPLHFGSLVAAVGSYLDARASNGEWLVRIEDLDPPREEPGAAQRILETLDAFGMQSDGEVLWQHERHEHYRTALRRLENLGQCFPCGCTRRELRQADGMRTAAGIYPGTCRNGVPPGREARSIRLRVPDREIVFHDRLQGEIREWLPRECGDFILRRADGLFAYQLAVVVDDALQGITHVVRGADLLSSTPRQILLQQLLGYPLPSYLHLPVAANAAGEKLSKQTHAPPVDSRRPVETLCEVLRFLGQDPAPELQRAPLETFWQFAIAGWRPAALPATHLVEQR